MEEKEQLQLEIRYHLTKVSNSAQEYRAFLDTIAKFHKYSIMEQINLHYRTSAEASAVAPDHVWRNSFRTTLRDGAAAIPLLVSEPNDQYTVRYVYDIRDTIAFQNGDAAVQGIPWQFTPAHEALVKRTLGSDSGSLDEAIRAKVAELVAAQNSEHADFLTASVEYVVRSRLGLSNQNTFPAELSIPQDVHIAVVLGEVNQVSRTILDSLGNAITAANRANAAKQKEADSNDRRSDPEISLWDLGRHEAGLFAQNPAGGVEADAGRRDAGSVSERLRGHDVRTVGGADSSDLQAGRRDGRPQEARRDAVDSELQQRSRRGAGTPGGGDHAGAPGSVRVDEFSIRIPDVLQEESANKFFEDVQTARNEGHITGVQSREMYLSFVRALMSAETLSSEAQNALIGRAYYELAATYATPAAAQELHPAEKSEAAVNALEESAPGTDSVEAEKPALSMNSSIKEWYLEKYPDDSSGNYLKDITFQELSDALPMGSALYEYAGIDSSDMRENLFVQLTELSGRSYDDILSSWINTAAPEPVLDRAETLTDEHEDTAAEADAEPAAAPVEADEAATDSETVRPVYEAEIIDPQTIDLPAAEDHAETDAPPIIDAEFAEVDLSTLDLSADMSTTAGKRAVFQRNLAAVQIANHLDRTGNLPNEGELEVLRAYSGFGGLSEAFDARNTAWHSEHQQAKEIMTEPEYMSARASTLDAFYTPPEIVQAIYSGLEQAGFQQGTILDPSTGTGRFLHYMPSSMKEQSRRVGVELDMLTAKVAQYAADGATILNKGFERIRFPQNSFDLAISNVPFGNYIITDSNYDRNYFVHDYFLKKMMDQVRPGGLVVAITSHGTMDKKDDSLRRELAQKGELIRAVRLPNQLFEAAGTNVLSDLLIFRKREKELAPDAELPAWVNADWQEVVHFDGSKRIEDGYHLNRYFIEHPSDILGTLSMRNMAFGIEPYVEGHSGKALADELSVVLASIPANSYQPLPAALPIPQEVEAPSHNQPFGLYEQNGSLVYYTPQGTIETVAFDKKTEQKILLAIRIRDQIHAMYDAELRDCSDTELTQYQATLNELYDEYMKKYGRIYEDNKLRQNFSKDASYPLLLSLEIVENGEYVGKSDIFSKRTIHAYTPPDHADTPGEALMISMQEKGCVDIPYMAKLTGLSAEEVVEDLDTMQRYLRPSRLEKQGLYHFDAWASAFGQETTTMEIDPAGKGFRAKTRFARFNNIPELMSMFKEFADVRTADSLKLPVPEYEIEIVKAEASQLQKDLVDRLAERAKLIRQRKPIQLRADADKSTGKGMDNMLVVVKEGQSAALDPRIIDPSYPDNPDGKVNLCVNNVYKIYEETSDKQSTQVIFCDQSTPNPKASFTVYADIREKLVEKGVPKEQIAFIHDYDTPEKKEALFTRVRKGEVRVLLGSSDKLGVGTNIQDKLIASHDLDCPWKPSQIEQRFGRIVRRGNENEKVKVYRYVTDATFDSYMWQTNETKQRFISQVMTNRTPVREAEDVDEFTMTYAQLKAACTGNPLYKEQFELRNALQKLGAERAQYMEDQSKLNHRLNVGLPSFIKSAEGYLKNVQKDIETIEQHQDDKTFVLQGVAYNTPKEIGEVLADCARAIYDGKLKETPRGTYCGMKISVVQNENHHIEVVFSGMTTNTFRIGATTPEENAARLENAPRTVFGRLPLAEAEVERLRQEVKDCEEGLGKPFPKEAEFQEKTLRYNEVNLLIEEQNKQEDQLVTKDLEEKQTEAASR